MIHTRAEGPQLVLTTIIPFCKGSQITSSVQDLRNAEQITSLIQGLRNAEQRYLRLEQGQPYLDARQGIYGLAIETKKEKIARPESRRKQGSGLCGQTPGRQPGRGRQDKRTEYSSHCYLG